MIAAVMATGISANAAIGDTEYPKDEAFTRTLSLSSLTDYAIEDNLYAFADGKTVKVFNDGNFNEYSFDKDVTSVDIKDGVIYYGWDDKAYTLPEHAECEHPFANKVTHIDCGDYFYNVLDGNLYVYYLSEPKSPPTEYEGGFSNLKSYGETVYAMGGNELYAFNGSESQKIVLEYSVKPADVRITTGNAANELKKYTEVKFVKVAEGAFMTEIDLDKLDGEYLVPLNIVRANENTTALLLCESGNAAIVSVRDRAFAVLKDKISPVKVDYTAHNPYTTAQLVGMNVYASPFVVSGTVADSNAIGITVTVLNKIEHELLESVFYEVEYSNGEETVKGYVAEGFLNGEIREDNKTPNYETDRNYSESSDTKTILIILAVILLVLAAIAYISYVSAKGKKKKNKEEESK